MISTLQQPQVSDVLARLHRQARGDLWRFPRLLPALVRHWLSGSFPPPSAFRGLFLPVSPEVGRYLYLLARTLRARRVVEFGTSFGISTLYLAAAVRDNGGGEVVGTEIEEEKALRAHRNFEAARLGDIARVRVGDARKTLAEVKGPVDLVLLDGWKDLYLDVLKLLAPRLRPGAVVLADNIHTFKKALAPYVRYVQDPGNGFVSTTLSLGAGMEYSVFVGSGPRKLPAPEPSWLERTPPPVPDEAVARARRQTGS